MSRNVFIQKIELVRIGTSQNCEMEMVRISWKLSGKSGMKNPIVLM